MQTITELAASFHEYLNSRDIPKLITIVEELRRAISNNTSPPLDHLISTGIIPHIVGLLSYEFFDETKLLVECGWIIANIASGSVKHVAYLMKLEIVPVAVSLLDHPIEDVQDNGVWILSNVAGDSIENRDLLIEMGLVEKIENTLDGNSFQPVFIGHVSWLISNLCRGKPYPSPIKVTNSMIFSYLL